MSHFVLKYRIKYQIMLYILNNGIMKMLLLHFQESSSTLICNSNPKTWITNIGQLLYELS